MLGFIGFVNKHFQIPGGRDGASVDFVRLIPDEGRHQDYCDMMKRIPRIQFPKRHPQPAPPPDAKSTSQLTSASNGQMTAGISEVPAPPRNMAVGGKASLQPKRTPVSDREIEAILLGGCF